jgi:hypothetical protein
MTILDRQDSEILAARQAALEARPGPRVGDWVEFPGSIRRRISHIWPDSLQTSDEGSYYLGNGYVSMSGSLHPGVPPDSLTDTGHTRDGEVWFFHHDFPTAGGGVDACIPFRVYACALPAPR